MSMPLELFTQTFTVLHDYTATFPDSRRFQAGSAPKSADPARGLLRSGFYVSKCDFAKLTLTLIETFCIFYS